MIIKVRCHPTIIYYCTGNDARLVREMADGADLPYDAKPCFCTESFGEDGFAWDTAEGFEEAWQDAFGPLEKEETK